MPIVKCVVCRRLVTPTVFFAHHRPCVEAARQTKAEWN